MKTISHSWIRGFVTLATVVLAAAAGWLVWDYYFNEPWTRDGRVCADVVRVSPDVSGLVSKVLVHDNQTVRKGDVLFCIDQARFALALKQSEASLAHAKAALEFAKSEAARCKRLLPHKAVSVSDCERAVSTVDQCDADCQLALANRDQAKLNLDRSKVKAPVNGTLANFSLQPGNYVAAGQAVTALVDSDSYYVAGYFEETKLRHIHVGDPVRVRLMGCGEDLPGHVVSIAPGIEDRERSDSSRLLANVNPTFSWVRLAQRIPVRIKLDKPSDVVAGQTATVIVDSTASSKSRRTNLGK